MPDRIEDSFKDLLASLQTLKFYGNEHPIFKKSVDKAYQSLQGALTTREELVVGIVGEELALEKEILFDLSKSVRPTIMYLKDRGIEKIVFYRGVQKEELEKFITFLAMPKEEIKKEAQDYLSLMGIKNIAAGKLKIATAGAPSIPGSFVIPRQFLSNLKFLYEDSLNKVSDSLTGILNSQEVEAATLRFSMHNIMESLQTNYQEFLKLTTLKRYSLETYVHILNVSILAMHFSSKIGFNKDDVLDIGIAALFHDTGKLYISRKVLGKKDRLTEKEFSQIKSHTVLGAEILLKYVESFGILPVVVSFEHHLKFDMTGYPKIPFLQKPHIASLIVSICDVYDALFQRRGYKLDYSPDMIYNVMIKEKGTTFEPLLLDKFFRLMGVWPVGSIVSLSNGSIAVVRDEHEDDIVSPKVEVIYPADRKEIIDLKEKKDAIKIERFLNPWKEGKDFLHLI